MSARAPAPAGGSAAEFGGGSNTDSMSPRAPAPEGGAAVEFGGGSNTDYMSARAPAPEGGSAGEFGGGSNTDSMSARGPAPEGGTAGEFGGGSNTDSMSARGPAPSGGSAGEFGGGSNTDYTSARGPALPGGSAGEFGGGSNTDSMSARAPAPAGGTAGAAGATAAGRQPAKHAGILRNPVGIGAIIILAAASLSRTYVWMSDERLWREAVRRAPDLVEPKIQLAKSLRAADALELLNRARQQAPYNPEIPAEIGKVLLDEQQYEGAVEELSRAVALNPGNALAFNNRGVALAALGQSPAAEADFRHALALDPKLAEASENLKRLGVR
jgi:hypothetical protein